MIGAVVALCRPEVSNLVPSVLQTDALPGELERRTPSTTGLRPGPRAAYGWASPATRHCSREATRETARRALSVRRLPPIRHPATPDPCTGHRMGCTAGRIRTCNPRLWRPMLFQLSYRHRCRADTMLFHVVHTHWQLPGCAPYASPGRRARIQCMKNAHQPGGDEQLVCEVRPAARRSSRSSLVSVHHLHLFARTARKFCFSPAQIREVEP